MAETGHIFEQWAKHLEAKASGLVMACMVGGGLIGAVLGGVPLLHLSNAVVPHHLGYATVLIGAAAGAYLGWSFGERRAVGLRLQAEVARRQFQVEQSLIHRMMQLAPPPVQHAPVQPAPVQQAPVAPPPPPTVAAPPPPPAPAPVPPPMVPAPAPVTPLLTTPAPTAPVVPPVVSPIPAPTPEPPPAAAYAPQQAV